MEAWWEAETTTEVAKEAETVTIDIEITGVELGEASIIFTDAETEETVAVKEGDTTVDLISGSKYSVEIDSEALTIDVTEVDLSETIPEKITINVSAAVSLLADENTHIFDATTLTAATDKEVVADGTTFDTKTTTDNK